MKVKCIDAGPYQHITVGKIYETINEYPFVRNFIGLKANDIGISHVSSGKKYFSYRFIRIGILNENIQII